MLNHCHQHRLISCLVLSILFPLFGLVMEKGFESYMRYQYITAPIEKFYTLDNIIAHDVNLSSTTIAEIDVHRNSSGDYSGTRYMTLLSLGLKPIKVSEPNAPELEKMMGETRKSDAFFESGEKLLVIQEDLNNYINGRIPEGQYYWIMQLEIHLPLGITRTISVNSNRFLVRN